MKRGRHPPWPRARHRTGAVAAHHTVAAELEPRARAPAERAGRKDDVPRRRHHTDRPSSRLRLRDPVRPTVRLISHRARESSLRRRQSRAVRIDGRPTPAGSRVVAVASARVAPAWLLGRSPPWRGRLASRRTGGSRASRTADSGARTLVECPVRCQDRGGWRPRWSAAKIKRRQSYA
jgi:hypothetical protein